MMDQKYTNLKSAVFVVKTSAGRCGLLNLQWSLGVLRSCWDQPECLSGEVAVWARSGSLASGTQGDFQSYRFVPEESACFENRRSVRNVRKQNDCTGGFF